MRGSMVSAASMALPSCRVDLASLRLGRRVGERAFLLPTAWREKRKKTRRREEKREEEKERREKERKEKERKEKKRREKERKGKERREKKLRFRSPGRYHVDTYIL